MINTIIFDIGRVLVDYDWDEYLGGLFGGDRKAVETVKDAFFEHGIWEEIDRGVWTEEQIIEALVGIAPDYEKEIKLAWYELHTAINESDFTRSWISDLKERGYRTLYLSNWSYHLLETGKKTLAFTDMMDGGVFSCHLKFIKPDRRIYEAITEKYSLVPEECVFLDDRADNVEAAIAFGFKGIQVVSHEQAAGDLEALLKTNKSDNKEGHIMKQLPSIDQWMKEAKAHEDAAKCGMYLTHNGVVRESAKAKVRQGATDTRPVIAVEFSYDEEKVNKAIEEAYKMDGIYYIKVWLNEGRLNVGDDIMYVLIGGDIRPRVIDALQALVGEIKNNCVVEKEIYE